ncbi:hypothetical protein Q1695_009109 [Nippostrongylus brasiliensis]|nr:hypothetical protein Q1695_009109 [Nippostrongylus brasiliensis]
MEDEKLMSEGISTREAIQRLVVIGRQSIESWNERKEETKYGCSVGHVLCRNLFLVLLISAAFLLAGAVTIENQPSSVLLVLAILHVILLAVAYIIQRKLRKSALEVKRRKALEALDFVSNASVFLSTCFF